MHVRFTPETYIFPFPIPNTKYSDDKAVRAPAQPIAEGQPEAQPEHANQAPTTPQDDRSTISLRFAKGCQ